MLWSISGLLLLCAATYAHYEGVPGVFLGELSSLQYEVSGTLYAIDEETLFIKDFNYNGKGPDAFFYIGTEDETPSHLGQLIRYPFYGSNGEPKKLGAYNKQDVTLYLPQGFKISRDLKWFSVWCRQYSVDFGHVIMPRNLQIPVYIGTLSTLKYEVSGMVYAVDEETILIRDFYYDGKGPNAFFYMGTRSLSPDDTGEIIPYPQDVYTQTSKILPRIWGEDIILQLPRGIKISRDLRWLSVWSLQYSVDFGNVLVPRDLQIPDKFYPEPEQDLHRYDIDRSDIASSDIVSQLQGQTLLSRVFVMVFDFVMSLVPHLFSTLLRLVF